MESPNDQANAASTGVSFDDPEKNVAKVGSTVLSDTGKVIPRLHNLPKATGCPLPVLTFGIESSHPLIPVWPRLQPEIIQALKDAGLTWSSLGVYHRRQTVESRGEDTTIAITANRSKGGNWGQARSRIHSICQKNECSHLTVEMVDGAIYRG
jgi:hypothetical protein